MKRALTLLVALCTGAAFAAIDFTGVTALADRLGGTALTSKVTFVEWTGETGDKAQIIPGDGKFTIKSTSVHAASLALGTYLRDVAKGHISWCGKRMPADWALPTSTIDVAPRYPHAMAYNYCTLSYTMAYWSKEAWQAEIDRLALSGYTTALCMAGVQKIWKLTMEELGYTKEQREDFITDDAQQAWWLMGNLQAIGNGTPQGHYPIVSDDEIEADAEIGKFIVAKMREVGIEPVLQAFIGLVPSTTTAKQLADHFGYDVTDKTKVNIIVNGYYNEGQKNPDLIDPTCAVFEDFSDVWNKNLKTVYGMTDEKDYPKYLGGDLFHESSPPKTMTEQQKNNCAKFVQDYQKKAFPGVTWVLQNWQSAPVQDLRNGLDPEHTIIQRLDQSMNATDARTASYVNYKMSPAGNIPWVWVEVMNFGGNTGMHGAFRRFRNVGNLGGNSSFKGYGLLSEGLETNPVSYDMYHWAMVQSTQDKQNINDDELEPWLEAYRQRRYGYTDNNLKSAHTIFANTVWTCKQDQQGTMESVFCAKPAYNVTKVSAWGPTTGTPYDRKELIIAAEYILETAKAHPELLDLETFRYDFVEVFQQILADKAREMIPDCATSQKRRDEFRQMLDLLDRILACSDEWRLDKKEDRLKGKALTTGPAAYRRMITTWTPGGRHQSQLSQYAHRSYAGLVKNYYAKKWNAFFDVTEGTMSQAAYNTLCDTLDEEFPTMELPETPNDGDPIEIAEEILALIAPPAITWTGATDGVWEHANWKDAKDQPVDWENGKSVILSGMGTTITANSAITVGNISLENAAVNADSQGWIDPSTAIVIAANTTIEEAHSWDYTAIMSGGWFGNPQRRCAATGYHKSAIANGAFTIQFQAIDFSENVNWLKAVSAKIYQDGKDVKIVSTGTGVVNGGTLGSGPLSGGSAPATSSGYCIKEIVMHRPSVVTVEGSVVVEGEITLNDGESLALLGATAIDTISLEKGTATLGLGAAQELAINVMLLGSEAKLVLKGGSATLQGASGSTKVKLPKSALSKVVYVNADGEEQALKLDAEGYAKTKIGTLTYNGTISNTNLGWKNLTLEDLYNCVYTSGDESTAAYVVLNDDNVTISDIYSNHASVTLSINADGTVQALAYPGIIGLTAMPAVAQIIEESEGGSSSGSTLTFTGSLPKSVATSLGWTGWTGEGLEAFVDYTFKAGDVVGTNKEYYWKSFDVNIGGNWFTLSVENGTVYATTSADFTGTLQAIPPGGSGSVATIKAKNYTTLNDAITAANGEAKVTLIDDVTVTASINNSFKTWIEIPRGITLSATCGDFIFWNKAYTLDIYGTLDLGGNALSVGKTKSHVINLYTGGEIVSTSAKGLAIFDSNTVINVKANDGFDTAILNTPVQARQNTTIKVDADVTAVLNGNIVKLASGESGVANPVVTKTGAGTLEFNGAIAEGATLVLSEGTLKRVMSVGDILVVTVNGGTTYVIADNEDAKVVETIEGATHTFTCIERPYRYRVTDPGEISVNMPGKNYETLAEALDAAKALQEANPGKVVNIWAISQEVEAQVQADLKAWNAANDTSMTLFGDGNGIVVKDWNVEVKKLYYVSDTNTWNSSVKVSNTKNGTADVTVQAGDTVTFASTINKVIYIQSDVKCSSVEIIDNSTITFGHRPPVIPDNWTVKVEAGSTLKLGRWDSTTNKGDTELGDNVTFNGEGTITFTDTATKPTVHHVKGDATITIPADVTVTVEGSIENPLAGSGKVIVKDVTATYTLAEGSAVTFEIASTVEGSWTEVRSGNLVTFAPEKRRVWESENAITHDSNKPVDIFVGITLEEILDGTYTLGGTLGGAWMSKEMAVDAVGLSASIQDDGDGVKYIIAQFQVKDSWDSHDGLKFATMKLIQKGVKIVGYQSGQGNITNRNQFGQIITDGNKTDEGSYGLKRIAAGIDYPVNDEQSWSALPKGVIPEDTVVLGESAKLTLTSALSFKLKGAGNLITTVEPSADLKSSLQATTWKGMFTLSGMNSTANTSPVRPINPSNYGNVGSVVELKNCSNAHFNGTGSSDVELKVTGTLEINDGYGNQTFNLAKLSGTGSITLNKHLDAGNHTIKVADCSEWDGDISELSTDNSVKIALAVAKVNGTIYYDLDEAINAMGPTDTIEILRNKVTEQKGVVVEAKYSTQKIHVPSGFERYGNFNLVTDEEGLWYKTADLPGDTTSYLFFNPGTDTAFDKTWTNIYLGPTMEDTAVGDWMTSLDWATKSGKVLVRRADGKVPHAANGAGYTPTLIDGTNLRHVRASDDGYKHVSAGTLDGWNTAIGVANGVALTIAGYTKMQGTDNTTNYLYVDKTSKLTLNGTPSKWENEMNLHVAAGEGIVIGINRNDANYNYYLEGEGSVVFTANAIAGTHVIKAAQFAIGSGDMTEVRSKKLVGFTSAAEGLKASIAENAEITIDDSETAATKVETADNLINPGAYMLRVGEDGIYLDYVGLKDSHIIWSSGTLWKSSYSSSESPVVFKNSADKVVNYAEGNIVTFKTAITPWLADSAASKTFEIDGCVVTLMNEGSSGNVFDENTVTIKNSGSIEFKSQWNGTPVIKSSMISVEAGSKLKNASSFAPSEIIIQGVVTIIGDAADITIPKFMLTDDAELTLPTGTSCEVVSGINGKKVMSEESFMARTTRYALVTEAAEPSVPNVPTTEGIPLAPSAGNGEIEIFNGDEYVAGTSLPLNTGVYTVKIVENGFEVASEEYAVIAAKEADESAAPEKTTTAVAVAFDGMTVATLLNNSLLNAGDTLTAYVGGAYWMWTLNGAGLWDSATMVRASGSGTAPSAAETTLTRGTAVWVTTAGKIVTFGKYTEAAPSVALETGHNLLANVKTVDAVPENVAIGHQVQAIGEDIVARYNKTSTGWESKIQVRTQLPNGKWKTSEVISDTPPTIKAGRGYWLIKK